MKRGGVHASHPWTSWWGVNRRSVTEFCDCRRRDGKGFRGGEFTEQNDVNPSEAQEWREDEHMNKKSKTGLELELELQNLLFSCCSHSCCYYFFCFCFLQFLLLSKKIYMQPVAFCWLMLFVCLSLCVFFSCSSFGFWY